MRLCALPLACLALTAGACLAQTTQAPGPAPAPASAAPQTRPEPNLRTDSEPRLSQTPATDSGPAPETLGQDATPYIELGPDWSKPARDNQDEVRKRLVTDKHGVTHVEEIATHGVVPSGITNPPLPPTKTMENIPAPPVKTLPKPPDPLAALPQPDAPIAP